MQKVTTITMKKKKGHIEQAEENKSQSTLIELKVKTP